MHISVPWILWNDLLAYRLRVGDRRGLQILRRGGASPYLRGEAAGYLGGFQHGPGQAGTVWTTKMVELLAGLTKGMVVFEAFWMDGKWFGAVTEFLGLQFSVTSFDSSQWSKIEFRMDIRGNVDELPPKIVLFLFLHRQVGEWFWMIPTKHILECDNKHQA